MRSHLQTKADLAPFEHGPAADVSWELTGKSMEVVCSIVDRRNKPLTNVVVDFVNNSGGNSATTDVSGVARTPVGESEVEQILVNGKTVMHRPRAYRLNYPNVRNGLTVRIVVNDPQALDIP